jgi:hypothetical protein
MPLTSRLASREDLPVILPLVAASIAQLQRAQVHRVNHCFARRRYWRSGRAAGMPNRPREAELWQT